MVKRFRRYFVYSFLMVGLLIYFYFAGSLEKEGEKSEICKVIKIELVDSTSSKLITPKQISNSLSKFEGEPIGKLNGELNLTTIEEVINKNSAVEESQVSTNLKGEMRVQVKQREPILRLQTKNGGFYIDKSGYIFPLSSNYTAYMTIINGNIPINIGKNFSGVVEGNEGEWISSITEFGLFLKENPFWESQIEQIYIAKNKDIILSSRVGNHKIIFGDAKDIEEKLDKLLKFYNSVAANEGWSKYSSINLKYKNQIICKLNK